MGTPIKDYDAIVVGMGPAGATTAWELSRAGLVVLGLEKHTHPRDKVCGGGLSARIANILPNDFPAIVEETVYRMQFSYDERDSFVIETPQPMAYMVMRSTFDQWLAQKARAAGTDLHEDEPAVSIEQTPRGIQVATAKARYRCQVIVGADGAMSLVARTLFPNRRLRKIPALESEMTFPPQPRDGLVKGASKTTVINLGAASRGYGWIFPKRNGLSVGIGEFHKNAERLKRKFYQFVRDDPRLEHFELPPPQGHPIPVFNGTRFTDRTPWNGGLVTGQALLVGDAGHLVDPLLGEGIYYAVRSGQLAAESILEAFRNPAFHLDQYERVVYREFGPEFHIAERMGRIIYGLPRMVHRWAGKTFPEAYHRLLTKYCELLQGRETYQTLWAKIMRRMTGPLGYRIG